MENKTYTIEKKEWGFIRETSELAAKAGIDADTGVCRTGLEEYLKVIFPNTSDWVHDKIVDIPSEGVKSRTRPDYRSESLKLIVEFDGTPHYTSPEKIKDDVKKTAFYEGLGYKVVRIPYFIQLTNDVVEKMFGVRVTEPLFDGTIPSLGVKNKNTPAYLCVAGIERMAKEFAEYPEQYETNKNALLGMNDEYLTGVHSLMERVEALLRK